MDRPILLLFRRDLRLRDHRPLQAALETGKPILPCFIEDREEEIGKAARWWRQESLQALDSALRKSGSRLILRQGKGIEELIRLAQEIQATALYVHRRYDKAGLTQDRLLLENMQALGVEVHGFAGNYLIEPHLPKTANGTFFRVFTPFWNKLQALYQAPAPLPAPDRIPGPIDWPQSASIEKYQPAWAKKFSGYWLPGEEAAYAKLFDFREEKLALYKLERDRPDLTQTSRLSPHLSWGEISPHAIWRGAIGRPGGDAFLRELGWRDFQAHLLYHFPSLRRDVFQDKFRNFPYQKNAEELRAWQEGRTGYPLVDAGMRELWETGWMHNRVRMVSASFLVKHLLIDWRQGEEWFWDCLLDADPAQNGGNWQWVAGSGADAAPYFRIFNPIRQSETFDPDGTYIKKWVPELRTLSPSEIHRPWETAKVPPSEYPRPIRDHAAARNRALAAFKEISADGARPKPAFGDRPRVGKKR